MNSSLSSHAAPSHELWFQSLFDAGRALAFPCDERGHVDIDALSPRARHNYFYARTVIGREFVTPIVHLRPGSNGGHGETFESRH
jgi:hypothetical protein